MRTRDAGSGNLQEGCRERKRTAMMMFPPPDTDSYPREMSISLDDSLFALQSLDESSEPLDDSSTLEPVEDSFFEADFSVSSEEEDGQFNNDGENDGKKKDGDYLIKGMKKQDIKKSLM